MKKILSSVFGFLSLAVASLSLAAESPSAPKSAYLFVHFTGESEQGEQIYFSVSQDGLNWTDLNNSKPVLVSNLGDKGVRDPAIVRSPDGKKFTILATDLRIANGKGWDAARYHGSSSLIFWESTDLLNWSEPWAIDVSSAIPDYGCTWAPEAIYDEDSQSYFVYWATISPLNGVKEARIYGSWTKDFRTFTPAKLYIDRGGKGVSLGDIIDTQIIEVKGAKYRFYRASRDSQITLEGADTLLGKWERIGDISYLGYTAKQVEGPILFPFNEGKKWGMLVDQYAAKKGYLPLVTTNFDDPRGFKVIPATDYKLGASLKRHGGILSITKSEYDALLAKWPSNP
ncbi:MAG: glycoside hydrolase family 43 protein [Luteolibacter sp.]